MNLLRSKNFRLRSHVLRPAESRRGFTLVEQMISGMLLGALFMIVGPTLSWIARERRATERHQEALVEVANTMERISSLAWDEITPERLSEIKLTEHTRRQLPDGQLAVAVHMDEAAPEAKRITVELRWKNSAGQFAAPVRLTAWAYRDRRPQ